MCTLSSHTTKGNPPGCPTSHHHNRDADPPVRHHKECRSTPADHPRFYGKLSFQPDAYDPHLDIDFTLLRDGPAATKDGFGQAA
jgi:hypothetical protein